MVTTSRLPTISKRKACAHRWALLGAFLCALISNEAFAQQRDAGNPCGPIAVPGHYGPFDYQTERNRIAIVDMHHFNARVEALIGGQSGTLEGDLGYTLKSSPNHHRALLSLLRYSTRAKSKSPTDFDWPLECYFERAIRFQKYDTVARMIYAQFLAQSKRVQDATVQLETAVALGTENAFTQFNAGMIFFDLGLFDRALAQAHRAKAMGLMKTDLEDRLKSANRWQEPSGATAVAPGSLAAPTALVPPTPAASAPNQ